MNRAYSNYSSITKNIQNAEKTRNRKERNKFVIVYLLARNTSIFLMRLNNISMELFEF